MPLRSLSGTFENCIIPATISDMDFLQKVHVTVPVSRASFWFVGSVVRVDTVFLSFPKPLTISCSRATVQL